MAKMKRTVVKDDGDNTTGSKRRRKMSFSEDEMAGFDLRGKCPDSPPMSKIYNSACRNNKPAELFRKDLISAMKLPDNEQLNPEDYWNVTDSWKQEWERGVQVPVNSKNVPAAQVINIGRRFELGHFKMPKKYISLSQHHFFSHDDHVLINKDSEPVCHYDMDDVDCCWLEIFNEEQQSLGLPIVEEKTVEIAIENFEIQCFNKFQEAFKTEEGLGIEYDEDVICDVCRTPECEEGNEMVFCDVCNICVHQACYGITSIPDGSWVCRACASNIQPSCILCPNKGGAMKSTRNNDSWAHVSCALWIPEVVIVDAEKMEPITKISQIPASRWSLICTLCRERVGACIQCCVKQCKVAYHVTCAFEHGLEMKGIVDESKEDVKLKSYCLKHSNNNKEVLSASEGIVWKIKNVIKKDVNKHENNKVSDLDKQNAKLQKIRTMEMEFFKYVNTKETKKKLVDVHPDVVDFIYNYWRLKRTANFNKPLIPTKMDEAALLGKHPEDSLYAKMKRFVHLRQDLERVRNLCYMVSRREKLRRSFFRVKEDILQKMIDVLSLRKTPPKDLDALLKSIEGDSIYDQMYSRKNYKALDYPVSQKDDDKNKLNSTARLPNPYAKRYLNGTRTRRHSSPAKDSVPKNTDTETAVEIKEEIKPSEEMHNQMPNIVSETVPHLINQKQICFENNDIDNDKIPTLEPLDDIKNSPSQSDKENVMSSASKVRGRKRQTQVEKSNELTKAIANLNIKTENESECLKVKDNTPDTGRYMMRSRPNAVAETPTTPVEEKSDIEEEEKVMCRKKRRIRQKLFSDTEKSEKSTDEDEIPPIDEFKMTLRQGKLLWSPRKLALRHSEKLFNNDLRHRNLTVENGDTTMPDRDLTASPRLVLRLKKDPQRQQWEKEPLPLDSVVFKVVRNDWEESLSDNENNTGHRYCMRKRSKPTTPS